MKQAKRDIYLNALRQAGKRITDQRMQICEYLAETKSHPTPYQMYEELSARYPEISRATVYNTLNVLKELGAIVELGFGAEHTHYETDATPHINLICLRCHTIHDLNEALPLHSIQSSVAEQTSFLPMATRVDVLGFCETCRELKKAEIREQWLAQEMARRPVTDDVAEI